MAVSWSDNYTQDTSSKYGCQLEWQLHSGHFVYRWLSVGVTTTLRTLFVCRWLSIGVITTLRTLRLPMAVSWSDNYTEDTSSTDGCQLEWQLHSGHFVYRWLSVGVTTTLRTLRLPMAVSWSHNYTQDISYIDGCQLEWQLHSRYFVYRWLSVDQCVATERQQMYKGDTNV